MRCDVFVVTGESSFEGVYKFRVSSFLASRHPPPPLSPRLVIYHFVRRCATPAEYLVAGTARRGNATVFVPIPAFSTDRSRDRAIARPHSTKRKKKKLALIMLTPYEVNES